MAADREPLVDTGDDLLPGLGIDDAGAEIEALVVDRRLLGDADRRGLVHLADVREAHVIRERGGERVAPDDLALVVLGLGRGVAPHHALFVIELGDRPIEPHQFVSVDLMNNEAARQREGERERFSAEGAMGTQRAR
jgi:hypothetical protein